MKIDRVAVGTGVTLEYAEQGDPGGVPVVFLHGFADSWRAFELVLPHVPGWVRAIAWTQRGHGGSDHPPEGYRARDLAADLVAFCDALRIDSAVLVGGSSGGVTAQRFAIDHPERVRGLVLLASPITLADKPRARELFGSTLATLSDPVDPTFVRAFAGGVASSLVPAGFFERMVGENMKVPAHVWREFNRALIEEDHTDELRAIAAPTLILWGDGDDLVGSDQRTLASSIPSARVVVYEGAGHMLYWEQPMRVAGDVTAFVERHARDRP